MMDPRNTRFRLRGGHGRMAASKAQALLGLLAQASGDVVPMGTWRSILLLRHGSAGDVLRTGAVIGALRKTCPLAKIELACGDEARPFAELLLGLDGVRYMPNPYRSFSQSARALFLGAGLRPDVVIALHPGARYGWLAALGGRRHWIGHTESGCIESRHIYRWPTPEQGGWRRLPGSFQSGRVSSGGDPETIQRTSRATQERVRYMLRSAGFNRGPVLLAAGGGGPDMRRRWPETHFRELAQGLLSDGIHVAWIGTREDPGGGVDGVVDWRGETDPATLAGLFGEASVVVGNDSAPAILSGLVGVPTVVVTGPTGLQTTNAVGASVRIVRHGDCPPCWTETPPPVPCAHRGVCLSGLAAATVHASVLAAIGERAA